MDIHFLFRDLAYVFLSAIVGGWLAWRLRQPLILGYVLAGIVLSPLTPGPTVHDVSALETFAELGVIFLMFSVGIEFSIKDLLQVKWVALVGGPIGIILAIGLGVGAGKLLGWPMATGLVIGTVVSVTSTMVLMRLLMDRGEVQTQHGRITIAITLVEDLAAVVLIVLIPTFKSPDLQSLGHLSHELGKAALVLIPAFFLAAKVIPPIMRRIAKTQDQELFFVVVIAICFGGAALTQSMGLSLALGAFVGGLLISGSDYAHQSLTQLFPLRDMFVALFFVTIGLLMDPQSVFASAALMKMVLAMVALIIVGKFLLWLAIVKLFRYPFWTALLVAVGLTQIGEFSYVFVQVARGAQVVGDDVYNATLAASLVTILINAGLVKFAPGWAAKLRTSKKAADVEVTDTTIERLAGHVLVCGYTEVGAMASKAFDQFGVTYGVIDLDPDQVRSLRQRRIPCIFGDATQAHILEHAHVATAAVILVAIAQPARAEAIIRHVRKLNPRAPILARAFRQRDYQFLLNAGASIVVQPEMEAATTLVRDALSLLKQPEQKTSAYVAALSKGPAHGGA
ncbi:MAG: cation:proton antiporter [Candidatus Koribacter versatilis]|uniref:Cation:proton antiporter n=1 Tax=Candidatus Korobacter versatilis TaxID=658062 RepID=A0A932A8N8_9BACT|nr:cation:proton antiporter [Candidatus Koribacter versatilis]